MKKPFLGKIFLLKKKFSFFQQFSSFIPLFSRFAIGLFSILSVGGIALAASFAISSSKNSPTVLSEKPTNHSVLADETQKIIGKISFNIPSFFNDTVTFQKNININGLATFNGKTIFNDDITAVNHNLDLGTGQITAANVLYNITPGTGLKSTGGQNPTLSLDNPVTSVQGQTGIVSFTAGSGIAINGTTISNNAQAGNAYGKVSTGGTTLSAGNTSDTLNITAGSGITISPNSGSNTLTFSASGGLSGLTTNGILYASGADTATSLTPGTSGYILQSNGTGAPPSWVANSSSNPSFSAIASGTNTTAAMVVGSGATLDFTGSGTINASTLNGNTFASPGTIGSTTPNTGAFTTLTGTTVNGLTITNNGSNTLTIPAGKTLSVADTFTTSGSNPLTLTTTGNTNVTLPTTGTLLTNTQSSNQTITSTQTSGTLFSLADSTNISSAIVGMNITLSGTGVEDQTGLVFNLSGASGSNVNDIIGSGSTWEVSRAGDATFHSITTTSGVNAASITSSGQFLAANGSSGTPSYSFTNATATGLFLPTTNAIAATTNGIERMRIDASGNVGIGTTTPASLLDVEGATAGKALAFFNYTGTDQNILVASSGGIAKFVIGNTGAITTGIWNGTKISETYGGTNQTSYTTGDVLYASATNTLSKLPIGSTGQALVVSGGIPHWSTIGGGTGCSDCVISDPSTSTINTITPTTGSVTPLTLLAAPSGSNDIFDVKSNNGLSTYFAINSAGNITTGTWNGSTIGEIYGGTNQSTYAKGDILYASAANTLSKLSLGSTNQVLAVDSSGVPVWASVGGGGSGLCPTCVVTNPTTSSTNTIAPATTGVAGLTLKETSVGSADIADFQNASGSTTYLKIDSSGNLISNNSIIFANGALSNLYNINTNGDARFALLNGNAITAATFNGNIISTGSGTLTLAAGKTLTANNSITLAGTDGKTATINDSTTFNTNSVTFGGTEALTLAATKNVTFSDAFTTSGSNPLTLTTTGSTNVTLPTTGTLLTNTESANQAITSTQTSGTLFSLADSTNISSTTIGQSISLSGTGAFDQTGLLITLSGASGSNLNALAVSDGTNTNVTLSKLGVLTLGNTTNPGSLILGNTSGNNVTFKSSNSTAGAYTFTLPINGGTSGYILETDGSGGTSWLNPGSVGSNYWQLNSGILTPTTLTNTISIGVPTNTTSLATLDLRSLNGIEPIASISGATSFAGLVVDNSGTGDILAASSSGKTRFVVKQSGVVQIGDNTNGLTFDYLNGGPTYVGTARPTKQIVLSPEYAGAILTASGSANINGQLTSDASPSANFRTYYKWTSSQSSLQDYTVAVRVTLPQDFSAWVTSGNAISVDLYTNLKGNGSNKVDILAYKTSDGSVVVYDQAQSSGSSDKTWITRGYTASQVQSLSAGNTIIFYLHMYAKDGNDVQIGDIVLNYLAKF